MRIYFDTEFVSLWRPECMSVGMAGDDGTDLYLELPYDPAHLSKFSREVVAPLMDGVQVSRERAAELIRAYLQQYDKPELVCDFIGDWWLVLGIVPDLADLAVPRCSEESAPDNAYGDLTRRHHALVDARALRVFEPDLQPHTD